MGHSRALPDVASYLAWETHRIPGAPAIEAVPAARSATNTGVLAGVYDVARVSMGILPRLPADYQMLPAGASVGRGCGPVVITAGPVHDLDRLRDCAIAGGSEFQTAFLLVGLWALPWRPRLTTPLPLEEIFGRVSTGRVAAGVVPAEGGALARAAGLHVALDLGQWWEDATGLPVPLCATVARTSLGPDMLGAVTSALQDSVEYALAHHDTVLDHLRRTVDLDDGILEQHWGLFPRAAPPVLDDEGFGAVEELIAQASRAGVCPALTRPLR